MRVISSPPCHPCFPLSQQRNERSVRDYLTRKGIDLTDTTAESATKGILCDPDFGLSNPNDLPHFLPRVTPVIEVALKQLRREQRAEAKATARREAKALLGKALDSVRRFFAVTKRSGWEGPHDALADQLDALYSPNVLGEALEKLRSQALKEEEQQAVLDRTVQTLRAYLKEEELALAGAQEIELARKLSDASGNAEAYKAGDVKKALTVLRKEERERAQAEGKRTEAAVREWLEEHKLRACSKMVNPKRLSLALAHSRPDGAFSKAAMTKLLRRLRKEERKAERKAETARWGLEGGESAGEGTTEEEDSCSTEGEAAAEVGGEIEDGAEESTESKAEEEEELRPRTGLRSRKRKRAVRQPLQEDSEGDKEVEVGGALGLASGETTEEDSDRGVEVGDGWEGEAE